MLMSMLSNTNTHSLLVGMQNCTTTLEDNLKVSYKDKHSLVIRSKNYALRYLPSGVKDLCPYKNLD